MSVGAAVAETADLVLVNGQVLTLNGPLVPSQALAVRQGVVQHVGTEAEVRALVGDTTRVIDLQGGTALPGINDGHLHPMGIGTFQPPFTLPLGKESVRSISDIREAVAQAVRDKEPGAWIRGFGWDQGYLQEGRFPHKSDLDDISAENPVVLTQWSGHAAWVNSKALESAGIDRDTPSPDGGEIVKDGDGEPTGILLESASFMVNRLVPDFTREEKKEALRVALRSIKAHGITSITDAGIGLEQVELYRELYDEGALDVRLTVMIMASQTDDLREALLSVKQIDTDPRWLNFSQVKIAADGVPTQAKTAWMSEPYVGGGHGGLTLDGETEEEQLERYREWVQISHELGFQVGTHTTGDRAIDAALDAYEHANQTLGDKGLRHYAIHGDFSSPQALKRMAASGFGVNFNPGIKRSLSHQLVEVLGRDRTDYQWPYRTALDLGVKPASSSDAPVVPPDFLEGLAGILTRRSLATGEVFGENQLIGLEDALHTYTTAGAWQDHAERWKGTLAPGRAADITVLGGDLLKTPFSDFPGIPVEMTIVGGTVVHHAATT